MWISLLALWFILVGLFGFMPFSKLYSNLLLRFVKVLLYKYGCPCISIQFQLLSPLNTHSSPSTSTGSRRRHSSWKPSRVWGQSAITTAGKAYPPTLTGTRSCSGNSMLVCAIGCCCPSASCLPAPFSSVPSSYLTLGLLASSWV